MGLVESPATQAAFTAPTDVPTSRSGRIPARAKAWSMPTWTAPRLAPPESTIAVVMIEESA